MSKHINLEMPSVIGMGAIGPTLSVLTATFCSAFRPLIGDSDVVYPVVMFGLSALVAVFPTMMSEYKLPLKIALYPIAAIIIFGSAWGVNTGLSAGESAATSNAVSEISLPSLVGDAYAGDAKVIINTNIALMRGFTATNESVDTSRIDLKTQIVMPEKLKLIVPTNVWCFAISNLVYIKDTNRNVWVGYRVLEEKPVEQKPVKLRGGFFKRL